MSSQFSAFGITTRTSNSNTSDQNTESNNHYNNTDMHSHIMNPFRSNNSTTTTTTTTTTTNSTTSTTTNTSNNNNNNVQFPISLSLNNNMHQNSQNNLIESLGPFYHNNNNNNNTNSINNNNNNPTTSNNAILKNLRHYIYGADNNNNNNNSLSSSTTSTTSSPSNINNNSNLDNNLSLDLPDDVRLPSPLPREELNKRKNKYGLFSIRLTPYIDNTHNNNNNNSNNNLNDNNPSVNSGNGLFFEPIIRTAGPGSQLVIGRYTERVREAISKLPEQYHPVVFKSKVISRAHGCFKVDSQGNWFIKDVKSSSGTFLNHQRLSPASTLSKDYLLHDGDILQLGMDFRGGIEEIYKCVKMKVELNRSWKRKANRFNKEALQRIRNLQKLLNDGVEEEDCSICLSKIKPCQAIFISPCSHSWHFHCIRRLIMMSYPQFVCPNCRSTCDLEANLSESEDDMDDYVEEDDEEEEEVNEPQQQEPNENRNNNIPPNNAMNNRHNNTVTAATTTNNNKSTTVVSQPFSNNEEISSMDDINMS